MDVEQIQKINNLARELMKYGQASSMEEALKLAQAQVDSGGEMGNLVETPVESPAVEVADSGAVIADSGDDMLKKLMHISNAHTTQINELNSKLTKLIEEVAKYQDQAKKFAASPVRVPEEKSDDKQPQTQFKPQPTEEKPAETKEKGEQRYGKYTPGDVSVDQFFYYGGK